MNSPPQIACPGCGGDLREVAEPDLRFEECPRCGGIFLDRGELNVLATGLAGDIEYCSLDAKPESGDKFATRPCPKCPDSKMRKESLLLYSELIFDYCGECGGWFLDRGKAERMNALLQRLKRSQGGGSEFRGERGGCWVTVTEVKSFEPGVQGGPAGGLGSTITVDWRRIEVLYKTPLGVGLGISPETWGRRLWKLFGLQDLQTGDREFDREFLIRGTDTEAARSVLTPPARAAILAFYRSPLARTGKKRTFEILDDRVLFNYTDWGEKITTEEKEQSLIEALVEMVDSAGISIGG